MKYTYFCLTHSICFLNQCYECHLFITSNLQYLWNTPDLTPELLYSRPSLDFRQHFPFSDYNSITLLILLFHNSVLLYPPFDNSDISVIVPHTCLIVPSCIQSYYHTLLDLLFIRTSPLAWCSLPHYKYVGTSVTIGQFKY